MVTNDRSEVSIIDRSFGYLPVLSMYRAYRGARLKQARKKVCVEKKHGVR